MKRKPTAVLCVLLVLLILITGGVLWYDSVVPPITFETYEEMQFALNAPQEEHKHLGVQMVYIDENAKTVEIYRAPDSPLTETQLKNMVRSPEYELTGIYTSKYSFTEMMQAHIRVHYGVQAKYLPRKLEDAGEPWMELWYDVTPEMGLRVYICMEDKAPATEEQWALVRELTEPYGDLIVFVESLDDRENVLALPYYTELA